MTDLSYSDQHIRGILETAKTIAAVGVSQNPVRPSYFVANYMRLRGYRVISVNPKFAGEVFLGQRAAADLSDIPEDVGPVHNRQNRL